MLSRIGASPSTQTMELVFTRWDEVAGAELASHVRPMRLQNSTLVVGADHPIWATRARMATERMLHQLHQLGDTFYRADRSGGPTVVATRREVVETCRKETAVG